MGGRILTVGGVSASIKEWSELTGVNSQTICARLKAGHSEESAVSKTHLSLNRRSRKPPTDRIGMRFDKLTVISFVGRTGASKRRTYICQCDCGKTVTRTWQGLTRSAKRDCGCDSMAPEGRPEPTLETAARPWYLMYQRSAKQRKLQFALSLEQFTAIVTQACFYCGSQPRSRCFGGRKKPFTSNGIDRINNAYGYIADNVRPCCKDCNYSKKDKSEREFFDWVASVYKHLRSTGRLGARRRTNPAQGGHP